MKHVEKPRTSPITRGHTPVGRSAALIGSRGAALACTLCLAFGPATLAQQGGAAVDRQQPAPQRDAKAQVDGKERSDHRASAAGLHEASTLIGKSVYDSTVRGEEAESVGTLNDIVIDARTGEIRYGVLSFGGIAGFGDKLFAVPWSAFSFVSTGTDKDDKRIYAPLSEQKLEASDGFDKDNWPNMANQQWDQKTQQRWGQDRNADDARRQNNAQANRQDNVQRDSDERGLAGQARQSAHLLRASMLMGYDVVDSDDKTVGEVTDLLVTDRKGQVMYALLDVSDYIDGDRNLVAVPWRALNTQAGQGEDDEFTITLAKADKQKMRAVAYSEDDKPRFTDKTWARNTHSAFGQEADMAVLGYIGGSDGKARTDGWHHESAYNRSYDRTQSKAFVGTIKDVDTFKPDGTSSDGVKLTIEDSEGESHELHLGPKDYMDEQGLEMKKGDRVVGSGHQPDGKDYIIADRLTVNGKQLELRDASGHSTWDVKRDMPSDKSRKSENRATMQE